MAKLPAALEPAQLAKNKSQLAKLQAQIPNLTNKLAGLGHDAKAALEADYKTMFNEMKPGSLDPLYFQEMHTKAHAGGLAIIKEINALEQKLQDALKVKDVGKDKKLVAYVHDLESALLSLRASVRGAERGSDEMETFYKAALLHSIVVYQGLQGTVPHAAASRQDLLSALQDIRQNGTVDYAVDTLTAGGGNSVARKYSTRSLGPWLNIVVKHLPKLGKKTYPADVQAGFMRNTWIDMAANQPDKLKGAVDKLVANAADEKAGVTAFCDEYEKQVKKADVVTKALGDVWATVQKAAA